MLAQITQLSSSSPEAYTPPEDIACKVKQAAKGGNRNKEYEVQNSYLLYRSLYKI